MENQQPLNTFARLRSGWAQKKYPATDIFQGAVHEELSLLHEFAILSENSYATSPDYDEVDVWDLKSTTKRVLVKDWAWQQITGYPDKLDAPPGRKKKEGLSYSLWEKDTGSELIIALVFAGTENFNDWLSNSRWFTRLIFPRWWDQYHQTQAMLPALMEFIRIRAEKTGKPFRVVATGHSLGGGLAQQAAYACDAIKLVCAFDPSPVTGFYDIPKHLRDQNRKGVKVFRVYEKGEVLAFFRNFMRLLYPAPIVSKQDPAIFELRFDALSNGGAISQHNMRAFAQKLYEMKQALVNKIES